MNAEFLNFQNGHRVMDAMIIFRSVITHLTLSYY